ncbi:hypothetical protein INT81_03410 [Riemerella anatipestifer]|nr:hypothetical protein [Riemerella anatipestifer]
MEVQENKTDFEGDFTVVIFPLVKQLKKESDALGQEIGEALINSSDFVKAFNVVKGFLNLKVKNKYFIESFKAERTKLWNSYT